MRVTALTILASFGFIASAQLLNGLPECAQQCYESNTGDCNTLDIACICGTASLIEGLACCVSQSCNAEDTKTTIDFARNICGTSGVTVPTSAFCASSVVSSTSAASSSAASSVASSGSESESATTGSESATTSDAASSGTPTGSAAEATSTPASTGAAAVHTGIGLGVAMAGLLAAL